MTDQAITSEVRFVSNHRQHQPTHQTMRLINNSRWALLLGIASAFTTLDNHFRTTTSSTRNHQCRGSAGGGLAAIGSLVKKAKQAALRKYVENGVPQNVLDVYNDMIQAAKIKISQHHAAAEQQQAAAEPVGGPLQQSLTKRQGTITVIAEYKRKASEAPDAVIKTILEPEFYAKIFRESDAAAMAVLADERMGGCSYDDLARVVEEQRKATVSVPGPIPVINSDIVIDTVQIAQSKVHNVAAVTIPLGMIDGDAKLLRELLMAAAAVDVEAIVVVTSVDEAQLAVAQGATMLRVDNTEAREAIATSVPPSICKIAYIPANNDKMLSEIEDAWAVRRTGLFQAVWVSEALFKEVNNAGAVVKSMRSKSSSTWASPKGVSGRGEGAREYLGDILM
jgi:indole-3-glycerol phosphate synthase